MNTKRMPLLRLLVLFMPCGLLLTGTALAGKSNVEYEIVCPPNDGTTNRGKHADEPLRQNTRTGRIGRISDPTDRAIAKLACENAKKLESCCQQPDPCIAQCDVDLEQCLQSGQDPLLCYQERGACSQSCQEPVSCASQCDADFTSCLTSGQNPQSCFETMQACHESCPPPDPCIVQCDEEWIQCLGSGRDPVLCFEERNACGQSCQ